VPRHTSLHLNHIGTLAERCLQYGCLGILLYMSPPTCQGAFEAYNMAAQRGARTCVFFSCSSLRLASSAAALRALAASSSSSVKTTPLLAPELIFFCL
jgi:hypothetical protein